MIPLLGCASEPVSLDVHRVPGGLEVATSAPVSRVVVSDGGVLATVDRPPSRRVFVPLDVPRGRTLHLEAGGGHADVYIPTVPADLLLELPEGAPPLPLEPGDFVVRAGAVPATATLRVVSAGAGVVRVGERTLTLGPRGTSTALRFPAELDHLEIEGGGETFTVGWRLAPAAPVDIGAVSFPVAADGSADASRAADAVVLALGFVPTSPGPWGHAAIALTNPATAVRTFTVSLGIDDPAFAPRLPGWSRAEVAQAATLPAGGSGVVVLPVFVDPHLARVGPVDVRVTVREPGGTEPLASRTTRWTVVRPDGAALLFAASLPISAAGLFGLAWRGRRFLADTEVATLTLIACLGAVTFVVGAAFQLVGYGVAAALGPFAPFLTALFDDLFRVALLAALVTRAPRPGVVSAAVTVGFLMRGLALGGFHPADLLYLGNQIVLNETFLWLAGLTRGDTWKREPRWRRTLRLALGFAPAQAVGVALGLIATAALYRLYWAPWYAAALVVFPGFLYVVVAAVLSAPLADELDRVAE